MGKKALVTGVNGFVGWFLTKELAAFGYEAVGTDIAGDALFADLLDAEAVRQMLQSVKPDIVFHLAGQSSVGLSWQKPQLTFEINVVGTLNLLEAVRSMQKRPRIVIVGSGDEYGKVRPEDCPIKEMLQPSPRTPYAISKYTQESAALLYAEAYGMDIVPTRSFNHTGPRQGLGFAVPDFASQVARIEKGGEPVLRVGNLTAKRDVSDVRDVVRAYRLLGEKGKSGEVYNVGCGCAHEIGKLLDMLVARSTVKIRVEEDPQKMRPVDVPVIMADITKIKEETGYAPEYGIEKTLEDTLDYWRDM